MRPICCLALAGLLLAPALWALPVWGQPPSPATAQPAKTPDNAPTASPGAAAASTGPNGPQTPAKPPSEAPGGVVGAVQARNPAQGAQLPQPKPGSEATRLQPQAIQVRRLTRPDVAVALALADATALTADNPVLCAGARYVYVDQANERTRGALSLAVNIALLAGPEPYRLIPVGDGTVFRVEVPVYYLHNDAKVLLAFDTWDRILDPTLYLKTDAVKTRRSIRFKYSDGKVYTAINTPCQVPAAHCNVDGQLDHLRELTHSEVPIVSAGQLLRHLLNSDFGGLYPEFKQFDTSPAQGTAEEAFLLRAGVSLKDLGARNSDQRVILMRKPTSSPGFVEYASAAVTKPSLGPAIVTITRDFFTGPINQGKHPFENLADRKHDGSEIFLPNSAGDLEMALFNGKGEFVRSAPLNPPNSLACDRTIPAPFLPILQGPSGCIRCHHNENPQSKLYGIYQPAPNYLTWMLDIRVNGQQFDILKEHSKSAVAKAATNQALDLARQQEALARLVSLFKGETSDVFTWAGRTYVRFVMEASGLKYDEALTEMMTLHDAWLYRYVTPQTALRTLGYDIPDVWQASQVFNQLIPPTAEPLRVTMLRGWGNGNNDLREMPLTIDDWLAVYPEAALRLQLYELAQAQGTNAQPQSQAQLQGTGQAAGQAITGQEGANGQEASSKGEGPDSSSNVGDQK